MSRGNGRTSRFIATREHRRFVEFADAVRRHKTIGLCHGPAGVGKTQSARRYARWHLIEPHIDLHFSSFNDTKDPKLCAAITRKRAVFYTPTVSETVATVGSNLNRLIVGAQLCITRKLDPKRFNEDEEDALYNVDLIIIDEAERLSTAGLEHLRDHIDRNSTGLILIGMPGIEKRLARFPQLYSRIGFSHRYASLSKDELTLVLAGYWKRLGKRRRINTEADALAIAAIARLTGGNFRLIQRLFMQIERVLRINNLDEITEEVVEAAASALVIGYAL